jgi:hypothetical protein
VVSETEIEFLYNISKLEKTPVHFCTPDDELVVRNILRFLYSNSFSICETTYWYPPSLFQHVSTSAITIISTFIVIIRFARPKKIIILKFYRLVLTAKSFKCSLTNFLFLRYFQEAERLDIFPTGLGVQVKGRRT